MKAFRLSFPACAIAGKRRLDQHDLVLLQTHGFAGGSVSQEQFWTLLVLNGCCPDKCPQWSAFFIDRVTHHLVLDRPPAGRLDAAKLSFLIRTFTTDGEPNSKIERDLLLSILTLAQEPGRALQRLLASTAPGETQAAAHTLEPSPSAGSIRLRSPTTRHQGLRGGPIASVSFQHLVAVNAPDRRMPTPP